MNTDKKIGLARLMECFELSQDGAIVNRLTRGRARVGQTVKGTPNTQEYLQISVDGDMVMLHRVVFALSHGRLAEAEVDHIDRVKTNNHPDNLREVTRGQNMANTGVRKSNTSGHPNVFWEKNRKIWRVQVTHKGRRHEGGLFDNKMDAFNAANALSIELKGEHAGVLSDTEELKEAKEIGVGIESARGLSPEVIKRQCRG